MSEWDTGPEDEEAGAVMKIVGRQLKMWREAAGLTQTEFGKAIGYSEESVSAVERGRRVPQPEYLDLADVVLRAGGRLAALKEDVALVRYPKKVRDLKKLEAAAVELCHYENSVFNGLLQTEAYAHALIGNRRPFFTPREIEERVAGRMARQGILDSSETPPIFSFVQCESTLRRPIGGKPVMRRQLERLLEVGQFRNVDLQVLPLEREVNPGLSGSFSLLRLQGGDTVAHAEIQHLSRVISEPLQVQMLDMRYGSIRAEALTPRESLAFIEKVREET
ncbi:helix-turn-helix domain-containing protein [Streptomyces kronopolitis]|uniref:helix-turn-helix domain-containing protein n=1 Tax=Streptomyces kronopolitis TaxID=1612435 RepID=UPI0020BF44FA|nr:helix-turn-helix transcriptional regulator [Streptomyces kronopolitis]MCL6302545.1 helix-turn-helix domain-containing protein [Streptomyces kronopolitis]